MLTRNKKYKLGDFSGFISIPLVIVLSALVLSLGLLSSLTSTNESTSSGVSNDSSRAVFYAEAGARDALSRLSVNADYGVGAPLIYGINFANDTSYSDCTMQVDKMAGCSYVRVEDEINGVTSPRIITVFGYYNNSVRKIQYDVAMSVGLISGIRHLEIKDAAIVSTASVTNDANLQATLNGWTNPNDSANTKKAWFRYIISNTTSNPTVCSDTFSPGTSTTPVSISAGIYPAAFQTTISGLSKGSLYYYCAIVGTNATPSVPISYGDIYTFIAQQ